MIRSLSSSIFFALIVLCLSSCEKHDGIDYCKAKCEAELNGLYLIDQTKFDWGLNPNKTPWLHYYEYDMEFFSRLSAKRGEDPLYCVNIIIFADQPWGYISEPQTIKLVAIDDTNKEPSLMDYGHYCRENKISYATILRTSDMECEIVESGTFQFTTFDKDNYHFDGTFTLHFSEGTMEATFSF